MKFPRFSFLQGEKPYRLDEDYTFNTGIKSYTCQVNGANLDHTGFLCVCKGYCWDMATGAIDTPDMAVASLAHDPLCEMLNEGQLPKECGAAVHRYFRQVLQSCGCGFIRRWYVWAGVRVYWTFK